MKKFRDEGYVKTIYFNDGIVEIERSPKYHTKLKPKDGYEQGMKLLMAIRYKKNGKRFSKRFMFGDCGRPVAFLLHDDMINDLDEVHNYLVQYAE